MSAHDVLLKLLKKFGERYNKMRGLPSFFLLIPNDFNKFIKTGAMSHSIYHMK